MNNRRCLAIVEDCPLCHTRVNCTGVCDELCELTRQRFLALPKFHEAYHKAEQCRGCGHYRPDKVRELCDAGTCTLWLCAVCGHLDFSAGPVGCKPCNASPAKVKLTMLWKRVKDLF